MEPLFDQPANAPAPPPGGTTEQEAFVLPVSFAQQRLFFLSRLEPTSPYGIYGAFALSGDLAVEELRGALQEVVDRHETLRTTFSLLDGDAVQMVAPARHHRLPVVDLSVVGEARARAESLRLCAAEARRPFDLAAGPLMRTVLFAVAPRRHVLFFDLHHIVADGLSEEILIGEVATAYRALRTGEPADLPELPIQYGDFAHWQREWLQGEVLERLTAYWRERLAGAPTSLDLPTDLPRPPVFTYRGATVAAAVPAPSFAALGDLCRQEGATSFMGLVALYALLLSRHAGQDDVLIGSPVSHRHEVELERLIGLFLNTLVLRVELSGQPTFRQLLARVRETTYGAQEHQDLPFERLVSLLGVQRDTSRNPLFQAFFNHETSAPRAAEAGDLAIEPVAVASRTAKFDLLLNAQESAAGLRLVLEYCTDLFTAGTAARLLERFGVLLAAAVAHPDRPVADLDLLSPAEAEQVLGAWSANPRDDLPADRRLDELIAGRARRAGAAPAVVADGGVLGFRALDEEANRLARRLRQLGVGAERRVGVRLAAGPDLVVALLGVLKAGGAFVPIDPAYPAERVDLIVADSEIDVLLTDREHADPPPAGRDLRQLVVDDPAERALRAELPAAPVAAAAGPANLAYVIYTSGSTGRPKGVMVEHRQVVNYLGWAAELYRAGEGGGAPLHSSIGFDLSLTSVFLPLLCGRPVTLPADAGADTLAEAIRRRGGFGFVKLTPAHLELLNRTLPPPAMAAAASFLVLGGEALHGRALTPWRTHAPATRIVNEYGPTETVVGCCVHEVAAGDELPLDVPIGRPAANNRLYVLDRRLQPLPVGVVGELAIGGSQVSRGYLKRPRLTAERFRPDPFAARPGARLYLSGDLARFRPDGVLVLRGRTDHQVKVHGYRIEPGEVEAALVEHPQVAEAVVVAREEAGERRLVAYVVAAGEAAPSLESLRSFLGRRLPEYMVPAVFVPLPALPLTRHGKVDRAALPAPGSERPTLAVEYVPPRNVVEETLAEIWAGVLGIDGVGAHDDFFVLGGDSILSIQVVAAARARGLRFDLPDVFRHPTLAGLAAIAGGSNGAAADAPVTAPFGLIGADDRRRLPDDVEDAYPLSGLQQGMLFHIEERAGAPVFHSINSYRLHLPFDPEAFQRAVLHVTARHPNLRTSFDLTSYGEPLQLVHRRCRFPVGVDDLRGLAADEQERRVEEYRRRELARPFDLGQAPQLRFHVHRLSDDVIQFTLTENHAVIDGWSLHTLYDELLTVYTAFLRAEPPPSLPPLATTFRDFIALERQALASPASRDFWHELLRDASPPRVPRGSRPRALAGPRCLRLDRPVDPTLRQALVRRARQEGVSLKTLLLAAHAWVTGYFCGTCDVVTGLSSNGRPETLDGHRVGGLFLNTLPLRWRLGGGTWRDLVRATQELQVRVMPHRRYPLPAIQARWGDEPLLETSFVYLNFHVMQDVVRNRRLEAAAGGAAFVEETSFPVMTAFQHSFTSDELLFNLTCDRSVLGDEQIHRLAGYYQACLAAIADDPEGRYEAFVPLSEEERRTLLGDWAGGAAAPAAEPVHRQFAWHAARSPQAPCLVASRQSLTYGEVERRARQVSARLAGAGLPAGAPVGLWLGRGTDPLVALLGVLRAGGAFLPLDAETPAERRLAMLRQAGAFAVLARRENAPDPEAGCPAVLLVDDELEGRGAAAADEPPAAVAPQALAYLMFTSGSTGVPKAVAVEHRHLAAYVAAVAAALELPAGARWGLVSTPAADLGHTALFPALCTGGSVVVASAEEATDAGALAGRLALGEVDCLKITPSHLAALLEHEPAQDLLPRRRLVLGGEAADPRLVRRVRELRPECRVYNHYGPTETTVGVVVHRLDDGGDGSAPPLGRPLAGARVYVVDGHGRPVPAATPGELWIGGATVSRGYHGAPARTAWRFVPDPFSAEPGARLYRSGDRVRFAAEGTLEFLGRVDDQVKVRGFRVEPAEVAAALRREEAVAEAVVVPREVAGTTGLVAYVTARGAGRSADLDPAEIRRRLLIRLPAAMVPDAIVVLPAMPLTANGKVDRRALPAPEKEGRLPGRGPRDAVELQLVHLWEEVLGRGDFGIDDDFFALDGNSLLAIRLVARARKQFGIDLPLAALLEQRTVARLADALRRPPAGPPRHLVALQPRGSRPPVFCVHPGHGSLYNYLALARLLGPDQPFFGLQALDLDGDAAAHRSVEELAARYLAEVRETRPRGPYRLAGWSFGGLVAFEMAQRLGAAGEEVEPLIFLDVRSPAANHRLATMDRDLLGAYLVVEHGKQVAGVAARDLPVRPEDLLGLGLDEQIERVIAELGVREALPPDVDRAMLRRYFELRLARFDAIAGYRPRPYDGEVVLFRARDVYRDTALAAAADIFAEAAADPTYGWQPLCRRPIDVRPVPGDHESLVYEPHVRVLAAEMTRLFDELERPADQSTSNAGDARGGGAK